METLSYELQKELAQVSLRITDLRRELADLEANKTAFLTSREDEAKQAVDMALLAAKSSLEETQQYVDEILQAKKLLTKMVDDIRVIKTALAECETTAQANSALAWKEIGERMQEISDQKALMLAQKIKLQAEMSSLERLRSKVAEEQCKVDDDRGKFKAAYQLWQTQRGTKTE